MVVCAASLWGCAGHRAARANQPAEVAARAYLAALRSDDPRPAYAMLTDDLRREIPYEQFAARWKDRKAERQNRAQALEQDLRAGHDLGEQAHLELASGQTISLARQSGTWRLHKPLLSKAHAGSPHLAVELFASALVSRDYPAVMQVLSSRRRNGIGKQVDAFVTSLGRHLRDPKHRVAFVGKSRAELVWNTEQHQYKIVLILEGDEWRIDDVHIRPATDARPEDPPAESDKDAPSKAEPPTP